MGAEMYMWGLGLIMVLNLTLKVEFWDNVKTAFPPPTFA